MSRFFILVFVSAFLSMSFVFVFVFSFSFLSLYLSWRKTFFDRNICVLGKLWCQVVCCCLTLSLSLYQTLATGIDSFLEDSGASLSLILSCVFVSLAYMSIATGIVLFLEDSGARQSVVLELRFNLLSASRQQSPGWIKI